MEGSPEYLVILIAVLGSAAFLYIGYSTYRYYRRRQRKLISYMKRTMTSRGGKEGNLGASFSPSAFSLSGNLVKEFTSPITEHYEITNLLLGRGSSAEVVIGRNLKTLRRYAVKIIDSSRRDIAWRYEREMNILKDCDHTNIVRLFELYSSPGKRHFVMELCTGGHLGHALKQSALGGRLAEETARQYILQIVHSIAHCHNRGICHRDVKLQNILLESNSADAQLKLIDFGNACRYVGNCPMTKIVGTTYTAAPEVFRESYDERCDVWSIGVVTYILLSGRRPFESLDADQTLKARESSVVANILNGKFHFMHDVWTGINSAAVHFIQCCLEGDYLKRRTAQGILNHPWLTHGDLHSSIGLGISSAGARRLSRRLSRNLSSSELRRTSMIAVAFNMSSQKQQIYREIFQQIDKTGSGVVDRKEFHAAMCTANPNMDKQDIDVLFDTIDQDGNNAISFTEFVAATVDPKEVNIEELKAAFRLFDKEGKGYITKDDLRIVLSTSWAIDQDGEKETIQERQEKIDARIAAMFRKADIDSDGKISYNQFLFAIADGSVRVQMQAKEIHDERKKDLVSPSARFKSSSSSNSMAAFTKRDKSAASRQLLATSFLGEIASGGEEGKLQARNDSPPTKSLSGSFSRANSLQLRRQSDSVVKLSRTTFRQRASSIINFKVGSGGGAGGGQKSSDQASAASKKTEAAAGGNGGGSNNQSLAVPSLLTLVMSDVTKAVGMADHGFSVTAQDDMARRETKLHLLKPVDNLEDSSESSQDDESGEEEDALWEMQSRRMSSPAMLWLTVKRRASMLISPGSSTTGPGGGRRGGEGGDLESANGEAARQQQQQHQEQAGDRRERRRSSVRKEKTAGGAGRLQKPAPPKEDKDALGTLSPDDPDGGKDGGRYAMDDGLDSMLGGGVGETAQELLDEAGPEYGDADSSSASPGASPGVSPTQRRKRGGTIPRGEGGKSGSGSSSTAPPSASISALLEVSRRHAQSHDDDDDDDSDGASENDGTDAHAAPTQNISGKSDKEARERSPRVKIVGATKSGGTRDSFTSVPSVHSMNSFDNENSFTNDSSASDAEKLQELVHFLRSQQQGGVAAGAAAAADAANKGGMATILEGDGDERRISDLPFSITSMLSTAFVAGMNVARGISPKVLPGNNNEEGGGESMGTTKRRLSHS